MKQIIGRRREYQESIVNLEVPKSVACFGVAMPFTLHCCVMVPCFVMSPIGFKYFATFFDDFSLASWFYIMKVDLSFSFFSKCLL